MGPLSVVVASVRTNQSSAEDKVQFYSDLDRIMTGTSGITMVMGDLMWQLGRVYRGW